MGNTLWLQDWWCRAWGDPPTDTHGHPQISTNTDIHRHPLSPRELAGAPVAFQEQQKQQLLALPLQQVGGGSWCIPALWGTGDNGAASLINSGSGC